MRSVLATPTMGLAVCCIAGHPHWYCHHMGLGEPIGYGARLTMNNSTLYRDQTNEFERAVYITLLGDPSLRMEPVAPASALSGAVNGGNVTLNWSASADAVAGYHVYRASAPAGPFTRLTTSLITGNTFTDTVTSSNSYTYMVRAVALQTNPSGSYYNPSEGIFVTLQTSAVASAPPITVSAARVSGSLQLSWNSQAGVVYRVLARTNLAQPNWVDISGSIPATGPSTVWSDANIMSSPKKFYRIASP
jgi:hypothetical protein